MLCDFLTPGFLLLFCFKYYQTYFFQKPCLKVAMKIAKTCKTYYVATTIVCGEGWFSLFSINMHCTVLSFLVCSVRCLQTRCSPRCLTNTCVFHWLTERVSESSFSSKSLNHLHHQTVIARDLNLWDNVHHSLCVTCLMPGDMCYVISIPLCHVKKFDKVLELVGGESVINRATPSSSK